MLHELSITNFVTIRQLRLSFGQGLHVITGESGAGKSVIFDALGLLLGGRASADWVRRGASKAELEAFFSVPDAVFPALAAFLAEGGWDLQLEEGLILQREILSNGKSISRINGKMCPLSLLREVGAACADFYRQSEHLTLLKAGEPLRWLDHCGGAELAQLRNQFEQVYKHYSEVEGSFRKLAENERMNEQQADLFRFQLEEISDAQLVSGEEEELLEERKRLLHMQKILRAVNDSFLALNADNGILSLTGSVMEDLQSAAKYAPEFAPLLEQVQTAHYLLDDAIRGISRQRETLSEDPERLDRVEERLALIHRLKRKYGDTVEGILQYAEDVKEKLWSLENKGECLTNLQKQMSELALSLAEVGESLSKLRRQAARLLEERVKAELQHLHMGSLQFCIRLTLKEGESGIPFQGVQAIPTLSGFDHAEFLVSPLGDGIFQALDKSLSGGELSRLMLALKSAVAVFQGVTHIFDEIDTGISGRTAQAVAERLYRFAVGSQVICISHLPQVSSLGDYHFLVEKQEDESGIYSSCSELELSARVKELSRMLGGVEVTEVTLKHAREMLSLADEARSHWKG